jgi:hypothetical protein
LKKIQEEAAQKVKSIRADAAAKIKAVKQDMKNECDTAVTQGNAEAAKNCDDKILKAVTKANEAKDKALEKQGEQHAKELAKMTKEAGSGQSVTSSASAQFNANMVGVYGWSISHLQNENSIISSRKSMPY